MATATEKDLYFKRTIYNDFDSLKTLGGGFLHGFINGKAEIAAVFKNALKTRLNKPAEFSGGTAEASKKRYNNLEKIEIEIKKVIQSEVSSQITYATLVANLFENLKNFDKEEIEYFFVALSTFVLTTNSKKKKSKQIGNKLGMFLYHVFNYIAINMKDLDDFITKKKGVDFSFATHLFCFASNSVLHGNNMSPAKLYATEVAHNMHLAQVKHAVELTRYVNNLNQTQNKTQIPYDPNSMEVDNIASPLLVEDFIGSCIDTPQDLISSGLMDIGVEQTSQKRTLDETLTMKKDKDPEVNAELDLKISDDTDDNVQPHIQISEPKVVEIDCWTGGKLKFMAFIDATSNLFTQRKKIVAKKQGKETIQITAGEAKFSLNQLFMSVWNGVKSAYDATKSFIGRYVLKSKEMGTKDFDDLYDDLMKKKRGKSINLDDIPSGAVIVQNTVQDTSQIDDIMWVDSTYTEASPQLVNLIIQHIASYYSEYSKLPNMSKQDVDNRKIFIMGAMADFVSKNKKGLSLLTHMSGLSQARSFFKVLESRLMEVDRDGYLFDLFLESVQRVHNNSVDQSIPLDLTRHGSLPLKNKLYTRRLIYSTN